MVSSGMSRGCQSAGAERNAAFTAASTRAGSTAGWSAASAAGADGRTASASTIGFIAPPQRLIAGAVISPPAALLTR